MGLGRAVGLKRSKPSGESRWTWPSWTPSSGAGTRGPTGSSGSGSSSPRCRLLVYTDLTPANAGVLLQLGRAGIRKVIVHRFEDAPGALRSAILNELEESASQQVMQALEPTFRELPPELQDALEAMLHAPGDGPTVTTLAERARLTRRTCERWFTKVGLPSPRTVMVLIRLLYAHRLLLDPGYTVEDVALKLGYSKTKTLQMHLRAVFGLTAGELRVSSVDRGRARGGHPPLLHPSATGRVMTRILVVDDEPALRRTLERALCSLKYDVVAIGDAHLAYQMLDAGEYDLVLLDIHLPQMSGDTFFLALVRRWPRLAGRVHPHDRGSVGDQGRLAGGPAPLSGPLEALHPRRAGLGALFRAVGGRRGRTAAQTERRMTAGLTLSGTSRRPHHSAGVPEPRPLGPPRPGRPRGGHPRRLRRSAAQRGCPSAAERADHPVLRGPRPRQPARTAGAPRRSTPTATCSRCSPSSSARWRAPRSTR